MMPVTFGPHAVFVVPTKVIANGSFSADFDERHHKNAPIIAAAAPIISTNRFVLISVEPRAVRMDAV